MSPLIGIKNVFVRLEKIEPICGREDPVARVASIAILSNPFNLDFCRATGLEVRAEGADPRRRSSADAATQSLGNGTGSVTISGSEESGWPSMSGGRAQGPRTANGESERREGKDERHPKSDMPSGPMETSSRPHPEEVKRTQQCGPLRAEAALLVV